MPVKAPRRTGYRGALLFAGTAGVATAMLAAMLAPDLSRTWSSALAAVADTPEPAAEASAVPTPIPAALHSRWYSQTQPPIILEGSTAWVTVSFRNTGQATWVRGTAAEARLGEVGAQPLLPAMRVDWPLPNRPAIQSEASVAPAQIATFSFAIRGAAPGRFRLHLRPVVDGVTWMEDDGTYVDITVRPNP